MRCKASTSERWTGSQVPGVDEGVRYPLSITGGVAPGCFRSALGGREPPVS